MNILGLSAGYHDAAASVVDDEGNILFAGHSERYSRIKNDPTLSEGLLNEALQYNPTKVAWYENSLIKHTRQIYSGEKSLFSLPDNPQKTLPPELKILPFKSYSHHLSHAAAGFQTSPFKSAICVVVDAIGEWDCISFWYARYDDKGRAKYKKLQSIKYPHSLGLFYSAWTQAVGLKPNEEEYIMMGMAAYGEKYNWPYISDCLEVKGGKNLFDFKTQHNYHTGIPKELLRDDVSNEDVAASAQQSVEYSLRCIMNNAHYLGKYYNTVDIVYAGGVALNCVANRLLDGLNYSHWIMPNPGDAGSSLGAAALAYGKKLNWEGPYLGTNISGDYPVSDIIKELSANKIVGVANGRAEFGPRALGNRSLLADPRGPEIKDKVNEIKRRQKFRPFAPVILKSHANKYFDLHHIHYQLGDYMQVTAKLKEEYLEEFPAIVHHDGTARIQLVDDDCKSGIKDLLYQWEYWTGGCPMLLNTSLNIRGEPMVNTREDADRFEKEYGVKVC